MKIIMIKLWMESNSNIYWFISMRHGVDIAKLSDQVINKENLLKSRNASISYHNNTLVK